MEEKMEYNLFYLKREVAQGDVKFYDYRRARVKIPLIILNRRDEEIENLEQLLYSKTINCRCNDSVFCNHVVYEVSTKDNKFALQFSDLQMILGVGVDEKSW